MEVCVRLREALLRQIAKLELPTNFLDELIQQLGGPNAVAECTGRKGRVVMDSQGRCELHLHDGPVLHARSVLCLSSHCRTSELQLAHGCKPAS